MSDKITDRHGKLESPTLRRSDGQIERPLSPEVPDLIGPSTLEPWTRRLP
jgi:hypothetical protein